jgi:hypothetical protein
MADDVQNPSADPEVAHPAAASEGAASDGGGAAPSWAILRQVVIATADHAADVAAVRSAFGFGEGFGDPELKDLALLDATMPVSGKRYLELIGPENDTAAVTKWLTKIGGRGGYVLSVQHPDPDAVRARALERGVRVPIDTTALGHTVIQLHPQDVGVLLEVDGIADDSAWFWDDIDPGPEPDALVDAIVSVEVPVADPSAMNSLWHDLLGLGAPVFADTIDLGGIPVRFVPGGPSADWVVTLRRAAEGGDRATEPNLPGITFRLV